MTEVALQIEPHLTRLMRYARSLVRNPALADDLVQDTVMRALEKAHLYQSDTNLRGWLVTIAHNKAIDYLRRASHQQLTSITWANSTSGATIRRTPRG